MMLFLVPGASAGDGAGAHHGSGARFELIKPKDTNAPDFRLKDIEGRIRSFSEFKGKTVLLHFMASWCEPCKDELPALNALYDRYMDKGLEVIAISEDSFERSRPFAKKFSIKFPMLIDQYGKLMRAYRVSAIPVSIIINKNGMIEGMALGARDYKSPEAMAFFENLLK